MLKKIFVIFYFLIIIALPVFTLAQSNASDANNTFPDVSSGINFKPAITIPGFYTAGSPYQVTPSSLPEYIVAVYRYGGIFAGVVAMFMLVYAGWQWLLAGGNSSKISQAKEKISGVLMGLFLLFGGYLLLSLVSTNLISFKALNTALPEMSKICPAITDEGRCKNLRCIWVAATAEQLTTAPTVSGYCKDLVSATCPSESLVKEINIPGLVINRNECKDPRLTGETLAKLKVAVSNAASLNATLVINGAFRSPAYQQYLYDCYKNKQGNKCPAGCTSCNTAAKPSCETASHQGGVAIDVCIVKPNIDTCKYVKEMYNCTSPTTPAACAGVLGLFAAQQDLKTIMNNAGLIDTVSSEWWHFENTD
jgi:D-alanyl-D-alanine dipeptidase